MATLRCCDLCHRSAVRYRVQLERSFTRKLDVVLAGHVFLHVPRRSTANRSYRETEYSDDGSQFNRSVAEQDRLLYDTDPVPGYKCELYSTAARNLRQRRPQPVSRSGHQQLNVIIAKNFTLSANSVRWLQIRMESDNVFNHTQFANPTGTFTSANLGAITAVNTGTPARQTQLAAKFYF